MSVIYRLTPAPFQYTCRPHFYNWMKGFFEGYPDSKFDEITNQLLEDAPRSTAAAADTGPGAVRFRVLPRGELHYMADTPRQSKAATEH
jgi:hypothetical protein